MRSITVFCGSSMGGRPEYEAAARGCGQELARRGVRTVYGGGHVGLMGVLADAVLQAGGEVIGVIPRALLDKELGHRELSQLIVVESMHERKALMAELAEAFVALPGGFGTFEEFCEVVTWTQLGVHAKPCGLLNVVGYFDSLLALFDHAEAERFLAPEHRRVVQAADSCSELLDMLAAWRPSPSPQWIDSTQR